jgi:hypothetical protein
MRLESKHRFGKEISSVCRNFKNICKTIAVRNQHKLANELLSGTLFRSLETLGSCSPVCIQSFEDDIAEAICLSLDFEPQDEIYVASSCCLGHYTFKPGCYVVQHVVNGAPQFGEVLSIIHLAEKIHLICKCCKTVGFDEHFFAYYIERTPKVTVMPVNSIVDPHPYVLHQLSVDGCDVMYINIRAKLF